MKLLLDLQGIQGQSRHRGIGRYTLALTHAFLARVAERHDIRLLFNAQFESSTDALIADFGQYARADRRIVLELPNDVKALQGGNDWRRHAAERVLRHALDVIDADVVWHSSVFEGYADDIVMPDAPLARAATVATLYDLIPLHDPASHLSFPRVRQWYEGRLETLRRSQLLFAISEWARRDALTRLGLAPDRVINIGAAVDMRFRPPLAGRNSADAPYRRFGIRQPFVLYNGGFDPRKNVAALIRAFAALPSALLDAHQLVIVGRIQHEEQALLTQATRRARVPAGKIVYTGYVDDKELVRLYGDCALFAFPSTLEGFGLPPLEAMACGAPVITSNAASLPDVVGRQDVLFDPSRVEEITTLMHRVLTQAAFSEELRRHGLSRSAQFTWDAVAARAQEGLEMLSSRRRLPAQAKPSLTKRSHLTCILATAHPPAWIGDLSSHYDIVTLQAGADALKKTAVDNNRLLYVVDGDAALQVQAIIKTQPGVLLIVPSTIVVPRTPAPSSQTMLRHAYSAVGYQVLCETEDHTHADAFALSPLIDNALAVIVADDNTNQRLRMPASKTTACEIYTLPQTAIASSCAARIEQAYDSSLLAREARLMDDLSTIADGPKPQDVEQVANAIVAARPACGVTQWLVDVTSIASEDIATGVQRVVRNVLAQWLRHPPAGVRVEPIRFIEGRYHYARSYALSVIGMTAVSFTEDAVNANHGDVYIGLDWTPQTITAARPQLSDWHRRGVTLHFIIYDLLPLTLPEAFHPFSRLQFTDWLNDVTAIADHLFCISQATSDALRTWLEQKPSDYQFTRPPSQACFALGVDVKQAIVSSPETGIRPALNAIMDKRINILMVGTIEPRKGYDQALDAFELLWAQGIDVNLIIIGHRGWLVASLMDRLDAHAERGKRLFWLDDVADGELDAIYAASTVLLAASWGEGYGLPLIEAAQRGLPVIARDIPVFREVMRDAATYVNAPTAQDLAHALRQWIAAPASPQPVTSITWTESATALADLILTMSRHVQDG